MRMGKTKSPKRLNSARLRLSLATCSVVLVVFSAVVYAVAVPGAFAQNPNSTLLTSLMGGTVSFDSTEQAGGDGTSESTGATMQSASLGAIPTLNQSPLLAALSPGLESATNQVINDPIYTVTAGGNETSDNNPVTNPATEEQPSNSSDQSQAEQIVTTTQEPVFSEAAEAAFHAQLVKDYEQLQADYNRTCASFSNIYAQVNSSSEGWRMINTSPCDTYDFVTEMDRKHAAVGAYSYNGQRMDENSKWSEAREHLYRCYECLINCGSIIRDLGGSCKADAPGIIAYNSNDKGEIKELVRFQQHFSQIRL